MSSYYGIVFPEFWTGTTGRQLRELGKDAQLMGLYLATNRHANMLGLYRLRIDDVRHETGMGVKAIAKGLQAARQTDYALYDAATEFAWVKQMARFRLGLKAGEALREGDKRAQAINRIYHAIESNPFLGEFHDANKKTLTLGQRRDSIGVVVPYGSDHQIQPHRRGLGGGSPDTESDNRDQKQDQQQEPPNPLSAKGGRVTRADRKQAKEIRARRFGRCHHDPPCEDGAVCEALIARELADRRIA